MTALLVQEGNPLATVQDAGRWGFQHLGVSPGGPMDPDAFRLAQARVGNGPSQACIEFAGAGLSLRAEGDLLLASSEGGPALRLSDGEPVEIPPPCRVWAYLSVAGGIDVPVVLGSRSTHLRAGFGGFEGRALRAGDRLPLGAASAPLAPPPVKERDPWGKDPSEVRISWTGAPCRILSEGVFTPGRLCDRMGYRLEGPRLEGPFPEARSLPTVAGAVQATPDGGVIVLMADRQTTGGYPVIAVVRREDLGRLAQRRTGEALRFRPVPGG